MQKKNMKRRIKENGARDKKHKNTQIDKNRILGFEIK